MFTKTVTSSVFIAVTLEKKISDRFKDKGRSLMDAIKDRRSWGKDRSSVLSKLYLCTDGGKWHDLGFLTLGKSAVDIVVKCDCIVTMYTNKCTQFVRITMFNTLKPELNPVCYLLALLAHHFLHVSRIRVKSLTFRRIMSYIYGAPILDVSRSHTTTQHSR